MVSPTGAPVFFCFFHFSFRSLSESFGCKVFSLSVYSSNLRNFSYHITKGLYATFSSWNIAHSTLNIHHSTFTIHHPFPCWFYFYLESITHNLPFIIVGDYHGSFQRIQLETIPFPYTYFLRKKYEFYSILQNKNSIFYSATANKSIIRFLSYVYFLCYTLL